MTMTLRRTSIVLVLACSTLGLVSADEPRLPLDPEVPWEGDPDISALKDERLKEIWETVVKRYRRINPMASPPGGMWQEPLSKDADTQEYLITSLDKALHTEPIDWNTVYTAVLLLLGGIEADPRIPELARYIYQLPRPMKMSDPHGRAYSQMLKVLQLQQSAESAVVLCDAVNKTFWGNTPYHDRPKQSTDEAVYCMRNVALSSLASISPSISIPLLEKLAQKYPYAQQEDAKDFVLESEFEEWIKQNPDGVIGRDIRYFLKKAHEEQTRERAASQTFKRNDRP